MSLDSNSSLENSELVKSSNKVDATPSLNNASSTKPAKITSLSQKGVSRRKFLQGLTATGVAALTNTTSTFSHPSYELSNTQSTTEGSVAQRIYTLNNLMDTCKTNPTTENKSILAAWLKFNAAEAYASSHGWDLTATFIRHFLYGDGETIDISKTLSDTIFRSSKEGQENQRTNRGDTKETIARLFFQNRFNSPAVAPYNDILTTNQRDILMGYEKPAELSIRTSFRADTNERELQLALGGFGVTTIGKFSKIEKNEPYYNAVLESPEIHIHDRYDWDGLNGLSAEGDLGSFLQNYLRKINVPIDQLLSTNQFGKEILNLLINTKITLTDQEGSMLAKHGIAKEFDVKGIISYSGVLTIPLKMPNKNPPSNPLSPTKA